jgi:hypothetical protein
MHEDKVGEVQMANTLIPGMLEWEFNTLSAVKAKVADRERILVERFNKKAGDQTIREVFELIEKLAKPYEKLAVIRIKERYEAAEELEFDDINLLNGLYKACVACLPNKEEEHE